MPLPTGRRLRFILLGTPPIAAITAVVILGFGVDGFVRDRLPSGLTLYFDLIRFYLPLNWLACSFGTAWDLARSGNTNRSAITFWTVFFTPLILLGHAGAAVVIIFLGSAIKHSSIL
jgi:hypothetical protein